jgi:hypothetical protein
MAEKMTDVGGNYVLSEGGVLMPKEHGQHKPKPPRVDRNATGKKAPSLKDAPKNERGEPVFEVRPGDKPEQQPPKLRTDKDMLVEFGCGCAVLFRGLTNHRSSRMHTCENHDSARDRELTLERAKKARAARV